MGNTCKSGSRSILAGKLETTYHQVVPKIQLKTIIPMKTFDLLQMPSKYYLIESFIGISYMLLPRKHMIFESTTASFNKCENINSPDKSQ